MKFNFLLCNWVLVNNDSKENIQFFKDLTILLVVLNDILQERQYPLFVLSVKDNYETEKASSNFFDYFDIVIIIREQYYSKAGL